MWGVKQGEKVNPNSRVSDKVNKKNLHLSEEGLRIELKEHLAEEEIS